MQCWYRVLYNEKISLNADDILTPREGTPVTYGTGVIICGLLSYLNVQGEVGTIAKDSKACSKLCIVNSEARGTAYLLPSFPSCTSPEANSKEIKTKTS